ncbi:hypothetical protein NE237_021411 [Protea cynaroides]|uniref:histidine kinase n=1 Tax=Protea cynaroides TaxID=273540 RepID=A0A9Q0K391_9MAGN|nr:hypothetical protein NE237_021411 [Protea cynaroides]
MKLKLSRAWHPVCLFIALVLVVLLIPCLVTTAWYAKTTRLDHTIEKALESSLNGSLSRVQTTAKSLVPFNSSALHLARLLSSSLIGTELSFSTLMAKVAPTLFLAFSTIPKVSQISFIGRDGLLFSYLYDGNQTLAVYSNTSHFSIGATANAKTITWYTQHVNYETGKQYGQAISMNPMVTVNASWFQKASGSANGYSSLGAKWNKAQDLLLLQSAAIDRIGVISLGFSAMDIIDSFSGINHYGGQLYLASKDGEVLAQVGPRNARMVFHNGTRPIQLAEEHGDVTIHDTNISCKSTDYLSKSSNVSIHGMKYISYCSTLDIAWVRLVIVYVFPHKELVDLVRKDSKVAFSLLLLMLISMVLSISFFILLTLRAARREIVLCATLIKQMESTQQAERKSMMKSLAFASASHDIRSFLATISGLIQFSCEEVPLDSKLKMNLVQMNACTEDLLGILNSVLDTSKIEAGKMQLEDEEFNLVELLEDVVDLYYLPGIKKGIDVVLDPYDLSILGFSLVRGDRGKLKQILCNLLSNAVKFTSEGHVSLRAWVKKVSIENSILASNHNGPLSCLSRFIYKSSESYNDLNNLRPIQQNSNTMEFVFEVNDTGKGIPKEKQSSVFENFVQVKETALGHGGHGLGLGIVQSLVRLMGGEIRIIGKEPGERGTCFRFNIFLATRGAASIASTGGEENKLPDHHISNYLEPYMGLHVQNQNSRNEGSHVVLLIQGDERRRISHKLIDSLGITVSIVKQWEHLSPTLEMIKHKLYLADPSSSGKSEFVSSGDSFNFNVAAKDVTVNIKDETNFIRSLHKRTSFRSTTFILIVIDVYAGPFQDMHLIVANFHKELNNANCKVVWLDKPTTYSSHLKGIEEEKLSQFDYVVRKPLHGPCLYEVLKILPEFGSNIQSNLMKSKREITTLDAPSILDPSPSTEQIHMKYKSVLPQSHHQQSPQHMTLEGKRKLLSGKKVLVAEDNAVLCRVAISVLAHLGATVEFYVNGKEVLEQVCKALSEINQSIETVDQVLPYDFILMDCEMPVIDGYEATRLIRIEERRFGIHIPIIALTADATVEAATKIVQSGMDFHLVKPLKEDQLLNAINFINSK